MRYGGFGSGPVRGEQLRPAFGPMNVDSMQGRPAPQFQRPPGLVAPPVPQGQGAATPGQGMKPMPQAPPQTGLPIPAGHGGSIGMNPNQPQQQPPMQQQMQGIMQDPFLMHIMRQRTNPGYGGQQFQRPFNQGVQRGPQVQNQVQDQGQGRAR